MNNPKLVVTKPLTIAFCIPGRSFSKEFLTAWSEVLLQCFRNNITPLLSPAYDPVVHYARNKCLGGSVLRGRYQKPFNGEVHYDYMLWIDSDVVFSYDQIIKLLNWNKQIVSGIYMMADRVNFATVREWDIEYFGKHGSFKFLTEEDIKDASGLMEVAYTGFGFMLMKRGVMESMEYPWFRSIMHTLSVDDKDVVDFSSEDSSMCYMLREKGYKILIDPSVRVGHEKSFVI